MALASTRMQVISGGKGQSAVAAAAYRSGEKLFDEQDGKFKEYNERKDRVVYTEILLPENAPASLYDRQTLWNAVQHAEPRNDAQFAREIRFALQKELTLEQNIEVAKRFAETFRKKGMAADLVVHDNGDGNPHAHIMLTMRPFNPDGTLGSKARKEYVLDENNKRIRLPSGGWKSKRINTTDWDKRENAKEWRDILATITNQALERYGHKERIDMRSYAEQGEKLPTIHLGYKSHKLEQQGIKTIRGNRNRAIEQENRELEAIKKELVELEQQRQYLLEIKKLKAQRQEQERQVEQEKETYHLREKSLEEMLADAQAEMERQHREKAKEHYKKGGKALADQISQRPHRPYRAGEKEQERKQEQKQEWQQEKQVYQEHQKYREQVEWLKAQFKEAEQGKKKDTPPAQAQDTHELSPKERVRRTYKEAEEKRQHEREQRQIDREKDRGRER